MGQASVFVDFWPRGMRKRKFCIPTAHIADYMPGRWLLPFLLLLLPSTLPADSFYLANNCGNMEIPVLPYPLAYAYPCNTTPTINGVAFSITTKSTAAPNAAEAYVQLIGGVSHVALEGGVSTLVRGGVVTEETEYFENMAGIPVDVSGELDLVGSVSLDGDIAGTIPDPLYVEGMGAVEGYSSGYANQSGTSCVFVASGTTFQTCPVSAVVPAGGTLEINLSIVVTAEYNVSFYTPEAFDYIVDFGHSMSVVNVQLTDLNGNPLSDSVLVDSSGIELPSPAAAPEPSYIAVLPIALGCIAVIAWRRGRGSQPQR